jgi:hypothetical protein
MAIWYFNGNLVYFTFFLQNLATLIRATGDRCYDFFFKFMPKHLEKKMSFMTKRTSKLCKKLA